MDTNTADQMALAISDRPYMPIGETPKMETLPDKQDQSQPELIGAVNNDHLL